MRREHALCSTCARQKIKVATVALCAIFALPTISWGSSLPDQQKHVRDVILRCFNTNGTVNRETMLTIGYDGFNYMLDVTGSVPYTRYSVAFKFDGESVWKRYSTLKMSLDPWDYQSSFVTVSSQYAAALESLLTATRSESANAALKVIDLQKTTVDGYYSTDLREVGFISDQAASFTFSYNTMQRGKVVPSLQLSRGYGVTYLLILQKDNELVDCISFRRADGFFNGEHELFAKKDPSNTIPYDHKALAMLRLLFNKDGGTSATAFKTLATTRFGVPANRLDLFNDDEDREIKKQLVASMLSTSLYLIADRSGSLPLFDIAKKPKSRRGDYWFNRIYGESRNVYISAYLMFLLEKNRPIYQWLVDNRYSDSDMFENPSSTISVAEGVELAQAAMRYLTWGVEYTTSARMSFGLVPTLRTSSNVYSANKDVIEQWLGTVALVLKNKNYFPEELKKLTTLPSEVLASNGTVSVAEAFTKIALPEKWFQTGSVEYSSPFKDGVAGYPLPWSKGGIDSPRTFAYKMKEQLRVRASLNNEVPDTTRAIIPMKTDLKKVITPENILFYCDDTRLRKLGATPNRDGWNYNGQLYFPFLPSGNESAPKHAGVDTMGFLSGSIAMTSFGNLVANFNPNNQALDEHPGTRLDEYFRMTAGTDANGALAANGRPVYSSTSTWDSTISPMRLTKEGLERCSVVVPDLSLLRVGDLIVRYGNGSIVDPTQVGIVVWLPPEGDAIRPAFGTNGATYMEHIVVVSVREGYRQVTLGTWGNPGGVFGGFAADPKLFHARRLVKLEISTGASVSPLWDVASLRPSHNMLRILSMFEHTRQGARRDLRERWIPNTGEYLLLDEVTARFRNPSGALIDPVLMKAANGNKPWLRFLLEDRNYDATKTPAATGNVFNNLGTGFELVALYPNGTTELVVKFNRTAGSKSYTADYTNSLFYTNDGPIVNRRMEVDMLTGTVFVENAPDAKLALRPLTGAGCRPGDDVYLKAELVTCISST